MRKINRIQNDIFILLETKSDSNRRTKKLKSLEGELLTAKIKELYANE